MSTTTRRIPEYSFRDRREAVAWMARKLARSQDPASAYSWFTSGDALDDPSGPPAGPVRTYLVWLGWEDELNDGRKLSTISQMRRFRRDCFAAARKLTRRGVGGEKPRPSGRGGKAPTEFRLAQEHADT